MAFARKAAVQTRDIYAEVTTKIIADLEAGIAPWAKPWGSAGNGSAMPSNATTKRHYSGVNILILWGAAQANGFTSSRWLTFNQARDAGGNIAKGSKGTTVVYASTFVPEAEKARGDDARAISFLKSFTVFNLDQCEGLDHLRGEETPAHQRPVCRCCGRQCRRSWFGMAVARRSIRLRMTLCRCRRWPRFRVALDYSRTLRA